MVSAFSFSAKSQVLNPTLISATYGNTLDTVVNTGVNYLVLPASAPVKGYFRTALIVFKADKISGTIGGTAIPQVSANGTDYADLPGATSYTLTDVATQSIAWVVSTGWVGAKVRVKVSGTGTMSAKVQGSALFKN